MKNAGYKAKCRGKFNYCEKTPTRMHRKRRLETYVYEIYLYGIMYGSNFLERLGVDGFAIYHRP